MSFHAGQERFRKAVGILVDDPERIRQRLQTAFLGQLMLIDPNHDLPDDLVAEFEQLKMRLQNAEVAGDTGRATVEIDHLTEDEAAEIAGEIYSMFLRLCGTAAGTR